MIRTKRRVRGVAFAALLAFCGTSAAANGPPSYDVQYLGPGSPVAISNTGVVVGARLAGTTYTPLVSVGGRAFTPLPVPADAVSSFPTDVNDAGVIVGVSYDAQMNPRALRWRDTGAGYQFEFLPRLSGDGASYATAINNLGQVVGARRALGYVPTGGGWLLDGNGLVDLQARYGWVVVPSDLNDAGQVIGGSERLDLSTGKLEWIGDGPTQYNPVIGAAINARGLIAGTASLRSTSLNSVALFRYEGAAGWRLLTGSSRYTVASSINAAGDIGYGELGAGLYLDGLGIFAVNDLLAPAAIAAGWAVTGNGAEINDQRFVVTVGRNSITGQAGAVLLYPVGSFEPPPPPPKAMRVASIVLDDKATGKKVSISGEVKVVDAGGSGLANAAVSFRWSLPGGATQLASAATGSNGAVRFTTSGARGTYTLTVTGVELSGYALDTASSVLSGSISR